MAFGIHWQVQFRSFDGTPYVLNIYDEGYTGSVVSLTGGKDPFITQEDNDDDPFTPVRTQSGYLNIFDDGTVDWASIIPTTSLQRPVALMRMTPLNPMWIGFLTPQTFSGDLYGDPQIRKLPVRCMLSVLKGITVRPSSIINFANLLYQILVEPFADTLPFNMFYFSCGSSVDEWLRKRCNTDNFYDFDDDGTKTSKYSAFDLLEEFCKFWGWSCRTSRNNVYFCSPMVNGTPAWLGYNTQDLYDVSQGNEAQPERINTYQEIDLSGNVFADTDNEESIVPGYKQVVVSAKINKFDSAIAVDGDAVLKYLESYGQPIDYYWVTNTRHFFEQVDSIDHAVPVSQGLGLITIPCPDCTIEIDVDMSTDTHHAYGYATAYYIYEGQLADLHDLPFTAGVQAMYNPLHDTIPQFACFRVISRHVVNVDNGVLVIQATTSAIINSWGNLKIYNAYCECTCLLQVGTKYWDGEAWVSTFATFTATFGGTEWKEGQGSIPSNRPIDPTTWKSDYPNYGGYGIPVDSPMAGKITFAVLQVGSMPDVTEGQQRILFQNLKLEFLRANDAAPLKDVDENKYTGTYTSAFEQEYTVDTIFASDNGNAAGVGIIMNEDNSYCSEVAYTEGSGGFYAHPEQHTADVISAYGVRTRRKIVGNFLSSAVSGINPRCKCTLDDLTYYPVSISHDWREDVTTLTLAEAITYS